MSDCQHYAIAIAGRSNVRPFAVDHELCRYCRVWVPVSEVAV